MRTLNFFYLLAALLWLMGCAAPKSTTVSSPQNSVYSEDLSIWRPKTDGTSNTPTNQTDSSVPKQTQYVEPKYAVNRQLDTVLDSIDRYNIARKFIDGFTIQIYTGLKKEDALNAKKNLSTSLPDLQCDVEYTQPNFRVKVGRYYNRLDAQREYVLVKKYFPTAIVIPDKVEIN